MRPSDSPLIKEAVIRDKIAELGRRLSEDYADKDLVVIAVLNGAVHFASDLTRAVTIPMEIDFVRVQSYKGRVSTGELEYRLWPSTPLAGKDVLVVEDILDTGRTASDVLMRLREQAPASLSFCPFIIKDVERKEEPDCAYWGFHVPDVFVVGYGMDYDGRYRELPDIRILEET